VLTGEPVTFVSWKLNPLLEQTALVHPRTVSRMPALFELTVPVVDAARAFSVLA
jgi:hypothetical protein